ncbi:MAG: right-handed parallel beta-helix repeat-containing protein, partial [Acidimicrobiales bacterium]
MSVVRPPTSAAQVLGFGDAKAFGDLTSLAAPIVAIASRESASGYFLAGADGGVFAYGDAVFRGSMGGRSLAAPIVGMAVTPSGSGYYLVAADGGVFAFGDAVFRGSMGGRSLAAPIVGMAVTPSGSGYYLVASDGGVFAFGARFKGSMAGRPIARPVIGIASTATGDGYYLGSSDGGVFAFGDAVFRGSMAGRGLAASITGIDVSPSGGGYYLVGADGGIFSFGDAAFHGTPATPGQSRVVAMAVTASGYVVVNSTTAAAAIPTVAIPSDLPTAATTGLVDGVALSPSPGFTASQDSAVYANLDVAGNIEVRARNVVLRNVRVRSGPWYAVHVYPGASAVIENCDVAGTQPRVTGIYVEGTATLNACHVHDSDI